MVLTVAKLASLSLFKGILLDTNIFAYSAGAVR